MRSCALDPSRIPAAKRNDIDAFLELHIEPGPVWEDAGVSEAIVEATTGIAQFEATLAGEQNHAGACPMDLRRAPMAGFAEITGRLIDHAHRLGRPAVTTIGRCDVRPGGSALVPQRVAFSMDARHPDARTRMYAVHECLIREAAERRGLIAELRSLIDHEPCRCDPDLVAALQQAADNCGIPTVTVTSGAGHDAQQMSEIARSAMIFVRSRGGLSHTPEEVSSPDDCTDGFRVLAEALRLLPCAASPSRSTQPLGRSSPAAALRAGACDRRWAGLPETVHRHRGRHLGYSPVSTTTFPWFFRGARMYSQASRYSSIRMTRSILGAIRPLRRAS